MTPAERNLLLILAKQRVAELKMAIMMVDQELSNPQMPEQQKAFLVMQRGQVASAVQETGEAMMAVQKEGSLVVSR